MIELFSFNIKKSINKTHFLKIQCSKYLSNCQLTFINISLPATPTAKKNIENKVIHLEKIQTASAVKKVIEDYLFEKLPSPSYDQDIQIKSEILFNDFKERYANFSF